MSKKAPNCKPAADRLVKEKPIALRLKNSELKIVAKAANKLDCSDAEFARRCFRAGIRLVLSRARLKSLLAELASSEAGTSAPAAAPRAAGASFSAR